MQNWEYERLILSNDSASDEWKWYDDIVGREKTPRERLDEMGGDGWELVSVLSVTGLSGQTTQYEYYFKRPIE